MTILNNYLKQKIMYYVWVQMHVYMGERDVLHTPNRGFATFSVQYIHGLLAQDHAVLTSVGKSS